MPIAEAGAGLFTSPIFVLLFSMVFFKERIGWRRIMAVVIGTMGVILVLQPGRDGFAIYHMLPVIAGASYAMGWLDPTGMPELAAGLMFFLWFPVFVLSGWSFAAAWDGWVVLRGGLRRSRVRRRHGAALTEELQSIHVALAD